MTDWNIDSVAIGQNMPPTPENSVAIGVNCVAKDPNTLNFATGGEPHAQVTLHADGRITLSPGMTIDEAAKTFWKAVEQWNPLRRPHDHLVNAVGSALQHMPPHRFPSFKSGDRVQTRLVPRAHGRVVQIAMFPHTRLDKLYTVELRRVYAVCDNGSSFEAYDFELEYDPLEQLARE